MSSSGRVTLMYLDLVGVLRGVEIGYDEEKDVFRTLFDASSVYGFEEIERSDLELRLPRERLKEIPWIEGFYAGIATIHYVGGERYVKDPRLVAEKTLEYLRGNGYTPYVGVEFEFFLFRNIVLELEYTTQYLEIDAPEAKSEKHPLPPKRGYQLLDPVDEIRDIRREIMDYVEKIGYRVVKSHHEVASSGQVEVTLKHHPVVDACDAVVWFKYVARNVAVMNDYMAVFMPKPLPHDNGSGLHIHLSLYSGEQNLFKDPESEDGLSQLARYFIGGLLEHGRSLSALVSPTVNSYRRLIPGYEAPTVLAWGFGNRSVAVRVPMSRDGVERIEYRPPDPMMNPYLGIPAIILAGLDGIRKKIEPPPPLNDNAYKYSVEELEKMGYRQLPRNLDEALDELESDHEYLKPVFPKEVIESYIEVKRKEIRELQAIPTPSEYHYYIYW